ncbi:mannitol dehydrogenase family protein [Fulvimarina sp. 2208YS6-2-32]|uniref:Mannitol dehydrogenase family protein n=1 Tax=Fulvimarina uroteuthidis TaxID=3098149 RepID=A0ABU5I103_9HYPH|nr:mannitol dehydrogenase family protein [Fulvimarina sp. 2208YS6-2-32]MDY8109067.1 mannitol dehydrogenase family protein [Fulvimarina sp. 2208YS6-2-32]
MTTKLSLETLDRLPANVGTPAYARADLTAGILHIGVGNFHRAHQEVYLDRLFETGRDLDWAVVGAGLMPFDAKVRDTLKGQDYLATVVAQEAESSTARVTGALIDFVEPGDPQAIVDRLADPRIRIVSLTVTEGGYFVDPSTGAFDPHHPKIVADAADLDNPQTVFGVILKALKNRRAAGETPFTVMSCDNLPHNGKVARDAVMGLAKAADPELAAWIGETVAFPSGMVDRITPATGERERRIVREDFGVADDWPVFCEDYIQWVLEDRFTAGRPALDRVGVQFVPDVGPYETMKIRILNGGHAVIAYPAGLMDIEFAHEAMENDLVAAFLKKVEGDEILPIVPPVPDTSLNDYFKLIETRFANPKIADTIRRLCLDGSNRQPKFIIPSIRDNIARDRDVSGLALASALWCRYCFGTTDSGAAIEANDPNWDRLTERAKAAKTDPSAWLEMTDIYGTLKDEPRFANAFADWLRMLHDKGTAAALKTYLG